MADTAAAWLFGGRTRHGLRLHGLIRPKPSRLRRRSRPVLRLCVVTGCFLALMLVVAGAMAIRLMQGPIVLDMLKEPLTQSLEALMGHRYRFSIGETSIDPGEFGPALTLQNVAIRDASGKTVVAAPKAQVELDLMDLALGNIRPTRFELVDLNVSLAMLPDGSMAIAAGTDQAQPIPIARSDHDGTASRPSAPAALPPVPLTRRMGQAINAAVDALTSVDSPIGALVRLGVAHGRLVIDDRSTGRQTVFEGFELGFDRDSTGNAHLSMRAQGPQGVWSAKAGVSGEVGADRNLDLELNNLSLPEIMLAAGQRYLPFQSNMPLSTKLHLAVAADGTLRSAEGSFALGSGFFHLDDPDHVPILIDKIAGDLRWDPGTSAVAIGPIHYVARDTTKVTLSGALTLPTSPEGRWGLALSGDGVLANQTKHDPPLVLDSADIEMHADPGKMTFDIDKVAVKGPEVDAVLSAVAAMTSAGPTFKMHITSGAAPISSFMTMWPSFIAPDVRDWALAHLISGTVDSGSIALDLDAAGIAASRAKKPVRDEQLAMDLVLRDMSLIAIDGATPLTHIAGKGHISGHRAIFSELTGNAELAPGRALDLTQMTFSVPDTTVKPAPAIITTRIQGGADVLIELLKQPPMRPFAGVPPDAPPFSGNLDSHVTINTLLGPDVRTPPVIHAEGQIGNYVIDKAFGDEKIVGDTLAVTVDGTNIHAKGDATILGAPATLEIKKPAAGPGEAIITATIDDALRARRGITFGGALTGPIIAHVSTGLGKTDLSKAQVELDLSRATIDGILPEAQKAAGKPGKASFTVSGKPDGLSLEQLAIDAGTLSARGAAQLTSDGKLVSAKLSQLRLSPGDEMRVEAARAGDGMKVSVHATTIDARPFLRALVKSADGPPEPSKDFDLDLRAQQILGQNQEVATGVDFKFSRRSDQIRQLQVSGRMAGKPISAEFRADEGGRLNLAAADAGAALAFLDLYKHMQGGILAASIRVAQGRQDGNLTIHDFVLRSEPAMSRLTSAAVMPSQRDRTASGEPIEIDPNAVHFARLQTTFSRGAGRIVLRDTVAWGPEIGASVNGTVDFAHDRINLHGTFVPAYTVNNFFSKIPLFGPILGGGAHEGLFAVNYRVSGQVSAPQLAINPLSVIAPGFLRQIFGAIDGTNPIESPDLAPTGDLDPAQ
jgi:hypothetical protein